MSKEGDLTEGDGRGEEGNTLMHMMCIKNLSELITMLNMERREGGGNRVGFEGGLNEQCVRAFF